MRLPIDTTALKFLAVTAPERVLDFDTKQPKADTDGQPLYALKLVALNGEGSEIISVKLAGPQANIAGGEFVNVSGLVASRWENNGRSGISFRADKIDPIARQSKAA